MRPIRLLVSSALLASLAACGDASVNTSEQWHGVGGGAGGGGGGSFSGGGSQSGGGDAGSMMQAASDGGGAQTQSLSVMLGSASADVELRNVTAPIVVTVAPTGYTGAVNLTVTGLPAGVTAAFDTPTLMMAGSTGASAHLTLTTKSDVAIGPANLQVVATGGAVTANGALTLNVKPVLTITIPMNVDAMKGTSGMPSKTAFGDYPIMIAAPTNISANPVQIKFYNADSAGHCIHASNATQGFPHDPVNNGVCTALTMKNQFDAQARNVIATGTYTFYLHDQGDLTEGQIKIQ